MFLSVSKYRTNTTCSPWLKVPETKFVQLIAVRFDSKKKFKGLSMGLAAMPGQRSSVMVVWNRFQ